MVVLDSSFLVAYHNTRDVHHEAAADLMAEFLDGRWGPGLLLEYVFLEVVTVLMARRGPAVASKVAGVLLASRELELVPCSAVFIEVVETFRAQRETRLSFTDAAIVVVARDRAAGRVLTFDGDFVGLEGIAAIPD